MTNYNSTPETANLVIVEWADIVDVDNWDDPDMEILEMNLVSVGWLLEDTIHRFVIAGSYNFIEERWVDLVILPKKKPTIVKTLEENHEVCSD